MDSQMIDKVAEKIGQGFEAIKPVAEEMVRQVQYRGMLFARVFAVGFTCFVALFVFLLMAAKKAKDEDTSGALLTFAGFSLIPVIAFLVATIFFLSQAVAPLVYLIGR